MAEHEGETTGRCIDNVSAILRKLVICSRNLSTFSPGLLDGITQKLFKFSRNKKEKRVHVQQQPIQYVF
jgi:hypothetical protein